jgi:hypothetical protein
VSYFYYEPSTEEYSAYEPTEATWGDEWPAATLYWYDQPTESYVQEEESPSPYVSYFTWNVETETYAPYEPSPAQ